MALIECPAPGCKEQVVDNWLSCPKCRAPVQVLFKAKAAAKAARAAEEAREAEEAAEAAELAYEDQDEVEDPEDDEPAVGGKLLGKLLAKKRREEAEAAEEAGKPSAPTKTTSDDDEAPMTLERRLDLLGKGSMGLGFGFGGGVPLLYQQPHLAGFCAVAALLLIVAGKVIQSIGAGDSSGG